MKTDHSSTRLSDNLDLNSISVWQGNLGRHNEREI